MGVGVVERCRVPCVAVLPPLRQQVPVVGAGALVLAVEQAEELEVLDQLHHPGGVAIEVRMALVAGGAVDDEGIGRDLPAEAVVAVALGQQGAVEQAARLQHAIDLRHRAADDRSDEHTSELQSLMRISSAVFCLKKKNTSHTNNKAC